MRRHWHLLLTCALLCGCGGNEARVHFEGARAALQSGDLPAAESHAASAASAGGAVYEALQSFVRGNVAFARSMALNDEVNRPNADARARAAAMAHAEDALAYWRAAAMTQRDWPAARRNVERALVRLDALREKGRQKKKRKPPPAKDDDEPREARVETRELSPDQVLALLELVDEKVQQRRQARRRQRQAASARVERDW